MAHAAAILEVLPAPTTTGNRRRNRILLGVFAALLAGAAATGWAVYAGGHETTDDAQVDGHIHVVSARIGGTTAAVYVSDNQTVEAGQPLVDLDPNEQKAAYDQAKAQYDQAVAQLSSERPAIAITQADNTEAVPHSHPQLRPGTRTGVWATTKLATDAGGWRQINRAGHPMMWPIFWPTDTDFTGPANTRHPSEDVSAAAKYTGDQIAAVVAASGTAVRPRRLRPGRRPGTVPRRAALRDRHPRDLQLHRIQRPHDGRQRPRGHAVPGHRHRHPRRAYPRHHRSPARQDLPLHRPHLSCQHAAGQSWPGRAVPRDSTGSIAPFSTEPE